MAYYTGSANTWSALQSALVAACVAEGWTWAEGILSKSGLYVRPTIQTSIDEVFGIGLRVQGGTGQSGGSLLNPSPEIARCGPPPQPPNLYWESTQFPINYYVHINNDPDEVYLIICTNITAFYWLAWGRSTVPMPGTGLWFTGTASQRVGGAVGVSISLTNGLSSYQHNCPGVFWSVDLAPEYRNRSVQIEANGSWPSYPYVDIKSISPLLGRQPNVWNGESVFLPVREYRRVAANKLELLVDAAHARLVRIDNLEPLQVIELGSARWRIYPFYRKNADDRNAGDWRDHSGTFGWALRE